MQNSVQQVIMYPRPALSTGNFWMAGCWRWWNSPGDREGLGHLLQAFCPLPWAAPGAALHKSPLLAGSPPPPFLCLVLLHQEGNIESCLQPRLVWRWLCVCVSPRSRADSHLCGQVLLGVNDGGSPELPVSQMCMVFYCSAARSSGKVELTLSWVQSAAFWYFLTAAPVPEEAAVAFSASTPLLNWQSALGMEMLGLEGRALKPVQLHVMIEHPLQ